MEEPHESPDSAPSPARPQSPASRGLRSGLLLALAAAFLALAANDSWLLPALDADGVAWLHAAGSLAAGEGPRVPVAHWSAEDTLGGLGDRSPLVAEAMAVVVRSGTRTHVAGLWLVAGSLALLALALGWVAGGAAGFEGGLLAGALVLLSPLAVEAGTALRPEALAAAAVAFQLGIMSYRPRWHLAHGAAGSLAWALHPAGAGAVAAAALWPFLPDGPPLGRRRSRTPGPGRRARTVAAALTPAVALLALGPAVAGLPTLPAVLGEGLSAGPFLEVLGWARAGLPGAAGAALGGVVLAALAAVIVAESLATPPVDPDTSWDDPRASDLVAARARAAAWILVLGLSAGAVAAGAGTELERPGLLAVAPLAALAGLALVRWIRRVGGTGGGVAAASVAVWILVSGWSALDRSRVIREDGRGLTSAAWLESATVRFLDNRVPADVPVYASDPWLVVVQNARPARTLPEAAEELGAFARRFRERPGVIVLVGADTLREAAFREAVNASPVLRGERGWILARP